MKSIFYSIVLAAVGCLNAFSQGCLPQGIIFSSQSQIDNFQTLYPGCTVIEGNVEITGVNITNLNGLHEITTIGGGLYVNTTTALTNLSGLENLTSIGGYLNILYNYSLSSLSGLENLNTVGGYVEIYNNVLTDLSALENLTSIGGHLWIGYNNLLTSISGLNNLTSIGGSLSISNNTSLSSLSGIDNIAAGSILSLEIVNNSLLSECNISSICNYLLSPVGTIEIHGNAAGCISPDEVKAACNNAGISEKCNPSVAEIFPNPANDYIKIVTPTLTGNAVFSIFTITGQQVMELKVSGKEIKAEVSLLPAGLYAIRLQNEKIVQVGKFIKE